MEFLLEATTNYLIDVMSAALIVALTLRFMAHQASKKDQLYYSTFTREIEKRVERDDIAKVDINDIEGYVERLLDDVATNLPSRGVRVRKPEVDKDGQQIMSIREYAEGSQSLIHTLKSETNAFKAKQKPNFKQLTSRVMGKDARWIKMYGLLGTEGVIRMIDVLPGIFIVTGIFGTFVGITNALPQIAEIDFSNISNSSSVLSVFVEDVSFAMYTSIAGIAFSLTISLLNTLFPINTMRNSIARGVEDSLEFLWYFVHGGRSDRQQTEAFANMQGLLESIDEKLDLSASEMVNSQGDEHHTTKAFSRIIHLLETLNHNINNTAWHRTGLDTAVDAVLNKPDSNSRQVVAKKPRASKVKKAS